MEELRDTWSWHRGGGLPAWLLSLMLHLTVLTTLGLTVQATPQGAAPEPTREGGIVLVARSARKTEYFADETGSSVQAASFTTADTGPALPFPNAIQQPATGGPQLPAAVEPRTGAAPVGINLPGAEAITQSGGGRAGPLGRGRDHATETQVFGVRGRGTRFVYVFDRSSSMEGGPLIAAKRELIASLQSLRSVHQFQIIFYNQEPQLMPAFRGQSPQMVFGDEPGKRLAASFVGGISAYGATDHMQALQKALQLRPDVVFFLTDADQPQLRTDDFPRIRRLNQGTVINAIEFGIGPPQPRFNFLQQLAAENGGQHTYLDVTRLGR